MKIVVRHFHVRLYINDFIVWVQTLEMSDLEAVGDEMQQITLEKSMTGFPLTEIEKLGLEEESNVEDL